MTGNSLAGFAADGCGVAHLGAAAEARILVAGILARRARARGDRPGCRADTLRALRAAAEGGSFGGAVVDCEPAGGLGGFFSCIAVAETGRCFAKGVLTGGREVRFWDAWRRGAVRTEGAHYRLVPPSAMLVGRVVSILVFPELGGLEGARPFGVYRRQVRRVVRAMADFNSDHPLRDGSPFRRSQVCDRVPVPGRKRVARLLAVDAARAGEIVGALRRIEPGWNGLRDSLYRSDHCLCHMDLGPTNIVLNQGKPILLDFGNAGAAPPGSELHTVRRYLGPSGGIGELVAAYAAVFAEKGIELDPEAVLLRLEAHFAARYRNLRFVASRNRDAFDSALATSLALLERELAAG